MSAKLQFYLEQQAEQELSRAAEQAMKKNSKTEAAHMEALQQIVTIHLKYSCCKKSNLLFILNWIPISCNSLGLQFLFCVAVTTLSLCILPCGAYRFVDPCHITPAYVVGECIYKIYFFPKNAH